MCGWTDSIIHQCIALAGHRGRPISSTAWEELRLSERALALGFHRTLILLIVTPIAAVDPKEVFELLWEVTVAIGLLI